MEGVRNMLLRLPVLPELELVLEGEELWTPTVLMEEGEEGRESCLRLILLLNIGSRDTRVERLDPESPIRTRSVWDYSQPRHQSGGAAALLQRPGSSVLVGRRGVAGLSLCLAPPPPALLAGFP